MTVEQINNLLKQSLEELYHRDKILLERQPKEDCTNHRLAYYLEVIFPDIVHDDMFYVVDIEYDRNLEEKNKEIQNENDKYLNIRPDIIIHRREDNRNNLLAIEAKYRRLKPHDILKIGKLLYQPYNYKYTAGIVYHPSKSYFEYILLTLNDNNEEIKTTVCVEKDGWISKKKTRNK